MSRLNDLIRQAKLKDSLLGEALEREVRAFSGRRAFGLNFERHRPEAVELPSRPVRRGDKVRILPGRGSMTEGDPRFWKVTRVERVDGSRRAHLIEFGPDGIDSTTAPLDDLVVVAEFRDTIYPGLLSTGTVAGGGDKPCHTVINGENYHALKALTYTHKAKVDAIYIDPPYNTGAKDWKYNNDYVDGEDLYRHSKWLAFMERRLFIAKELLKPEDSVLIVTIDEKEYLRLGMLLEQTFPESRIQMVSTRIKPGGVARDGWFSRSDEYYFFVMLGKAGPSALPLSKEWMTGATDKRSARDGLHWEQLRRTGSSPTRQGHPGTFYPIFVHKDGSSIHSIGDIIGEGTDRSTVIPPVGTVTIWPIRADGTEGRWQIGPEVARECVEKGYVKLGKFTEHSMGMYFLSKGSREKVDSGIFPIIGKRPDGSIIVDESDYVSTFVPTTQWVVGAHDSSRHGTNLLNMLLPNRKFPYPKSLYAVEDALRFFVNDKPDATVLDFFAGSGTTAHAVMRLNRQDGGHRQCISVTNNEVSVDEQKRLSKPDPVREYPYNEGLRPGDPDWEALGICDYVTKPRIRAAITGKIPAGDPIKGAYKFVDEFPMSEGFEENAEFFTLTYETPISVGHNKAFQRIAPLLWLRAGAKGDRIDSIPKNGWDVAQTYGVLFDLDQTAAFCIKVDASPDIRITYIVTNDERRFQAVAQRLPNSVEPVRLYESYLSNFRFSNGE